MMLFKKISLHFVNNRLFIRKSNSSKTLILKNKVQRKKTVKTPPESSVKKKASRKKYEQNKVKCKTRLPSDFCEDIWLDNINLQNLKLFRRTSFGSFRKIRIDSLIQKLKQLECDDSEAHVKNNVKKLSMSLPKDEDLEDSGKKESLFGQPQMSEYLVHNMTAFPLLRTNCNDIFREILQNEKDEYGLIDTINFPSVSAILNDTMPDSAKTKLKHWKAKLISELGETGFDKHFKDPESTVNTVSPSKKLFIESHRQQKQILIDLRNRGQKLHICLKEYFNTGSTEKVKTDPYVEKCWESLEKLLPNISEVKMIEETLYHPALMYKGIVDCVANYEGSPCVIDWKKSEKDKRSLSETFDAPLQVSAYLGALCWMKDVDPLTKGMVVVAYTSGKPATVFKMDSDSCQLYWLEWLRRLQSYWFKRSSALDKIKVDF